jgi:hypothetical protein
MGDEQNAVSQTVVATREAVAEVPVEAESSEVEEEEEEEIDDSKPLDATTPIPVPPTPPRAAEIDAEEIFEEDRATPAADEEVEGPQGYELEEEDEESTYDDEKPAYEGDEEEPASFTESNQEEESY